MKKQFKIEVDCANCGAKIESAIGKIEGVKSASINFLMQKLIIEFEDVADMKAVLDTALSMGKKIERDFEIHF